LIGERIVSSWMTGLFQTAALVYFGPMRVYPLLVQREALQAVKVL